MLDVVFWTLLLVWPVAVASFSKSWRDEAMTFVRSKCKQIISQMKSKTQSSNNLETTVVSEFISLIEAKKFDEAKQVVDDHPEDKTLQRLGKIMLSQTISNDKSAEITPTTDESAPSLASSPTSA